MNQFVITTDNGSDLSRSLAGKFGVDMVHLTVNVDNVEYDGINKSIDVTKIYDMMKKGATPSTSQVTPAKAEEFFEKYLSQGLDLIHVCLSGQISGTYSSCKMAADNLKNKFPERKIEVIDSISASLGQALLVIKGLEQQRAGKSFDEVVEFFNNMKHHICHVFTVDDLVYLQRGGRISKSEVILGTLIGIKPILSCDSAGKLVPISKVRGRQKSLLAMIEKMAEVINPEENDVIAISHGNCIDDANALAKLVRERFNINDIIVGDLGPVIGSHAGPGTLAVFCVADHRIDRK